MVQRLALDPSGILAPSSFGEEVCWLGGWGKHRLYYFVIEYADCRCASAEHRHQKDRQQAVDLSTSGSAFAFSMFSDAAGTIPALTTDAINGFAVTVDVNLDGTTTVANSSPETVSN